MPAAPAKRCADLASALSLVTVALIAADALEICLPLVMSPSAPARPTPKTPPTTQHPRELKPSCA